MKNARVYGTGIDWKMFFGKILQIVNNHPIHPSPSMYYVRR